MEKRLRIKFSNGDIFTIPARIIAENRAEYYADIDGYEKGSNEWNAEVQNTLDDNYEISVTPIQLLTAYCALVNGGELLHPYVVKSISDSEGNFIKE